MYRFGIVFLVLGVASGQNCYNEIDEACGASKDVPVSAPSCNAKYGNFDNLQVKLQSYVMANLESSYSYLLMSTHFGNYETHRDGFKSLYRKLSDQLWDDAVDLIKFIAKRGGVMDFNQPSHLKEAEPKGVFDQSSLNEMQSLAKALELQKKIANRAHEIYNDVHKHARPDASIIHFMEEKFLEPHANRVRTLAGHSNDLKKMLTEHEAPLATFMFDEYLQKA